MNTWPARRRPAACKKQEGAERLKREKSRRTAAEPGPNRRGREWSSLTGDGAWPGGACWSKGVPRVCGGDPRCGPQRNTTARRRAEPVAPIAGQFTPTPIVGAKRIQDLTLWTHRKSLSSTKEQKGDGGGPKSAPRSWVSVARDSPGALAEPNWNTPAPLKISTLRWALKQVKKKIYNKRRERSLGARWRNLVRTGETGSGAAWRAMTLGPGDAH
ncbi:hypothetical protein NDU88_005967 [Pleurodeles waltl]|uniref:Uncharacterized protein n=1 Tax=Pleurodeles waltl TaxID=8319 RepID=A0AAV7VP80_PLEWA|nr:hypothetical protein NDU88_005967 [Pleurodeles waltl]